MPANTSKWLDPAVVASDLAVTYPDDDGYIDRITNATAAYVERMRADLDFGGELPEDVVQAAVELATLDYQRRNSPSGFPSYGEAGDGFNAGGFPGVDLYRLSSIYRRLGIKNPRTA